MVELHECSCHMFIHVDFTVNMEMLMQMHVSDLHDACPHSWTGIGIST